MLAHKTIAGRNLFLPGSSEKGNGTVTISPFLSFIFGATTPSLHPQPCIDLVRYPESQMLHFFEIVAQLRKG